MVITILSQKGSQNKTSVAVNLAAAFSLRSLKGSIVDLDIQQQDAMSFDGSIPNVAFSLQLPAAATDDFLLVDTSPQIVASTGAALALCDLVVIPVTPLALSIESLPRTFATVALARQTRPNLKALVVFSSVSAGQYAQGALMAARALSEWPIATTTISARPADFERSCALRKPVAMFNPRGVIAAQYDALSREIL